MAGIISVVKVCKTYTEAGRTAQAVYALEDLSFGVERGEFLSILGPSGCGKTTCLRILAGLTSYDGGAVRVLGQQIQGPGPERAVVFQSFNLFPWKSVLDNVEFGLKMHGAAKRERREKAEASLALVGLTGFAQHYPHQLSGGMQQRVGLARALATDAEILLMDEPFGAIDAQTREVLQDELLKILDRLGKTVVFITHSVDEAIYLSDRVLVFRPRPGAVMAEFAIDLPKPRWTAKVHGNPRYEDYREAIWGALRTGLFGEPPGERGWTEKAAAGHA